ncbi:uncharacterized protein FSUBG_6938 [Fusarium subglutinans]|uniref:Uncharacterized protein n=1 Tax=Gibberella subglutinans TaxID=42677 RepID=A0A8H5PV90_GIBSU|nr:uncharacterized protein FSUBG_6938 [Fusarium subglutinans]KAF5604165.1 hypothetical protein FSUBG_6938 [Fusarium subglutinans]
MCSDFLADINNNHAKECRMNWGPKFVRGIKAITALGQLLLAARSELNVSALEIPGSYDNRGKLLTIGEKVQCCSRLYLEAFAKSEQSLGKLSETAWELAHSRGSLHHVTEVFRKENSAVAYSSFRDEWDRVHQYLNNVGQHASACFESWNHLLSFIQEFEAIVNDMIMSRMFLCALLVLRAGIKKSGYKALLDDNDGDQTRDLEIEIERLTQKHKLNATVCQTLQMMGSSLASAIGGIRDTHDSYKAVFDRLNSMNEDKIDRFKRTMNKISHLVSYDESYPPNRTTDHPNRTTDHRPRDSKDVKDLKKPAESNENPGTA